MDRRNTRLVRARNRFYNLFFIKPEDLSNANESAKQLMKVEGVEEVIVAAGEYGFIVKSRIEDEESIERITSKIHGEVSRVSCYYSYKK